MFSGVRKLLSRNPGAPGRHSMPRRTLARASVISVAMSSLLLVPLASAGAANCAPVTTTETVAGVSYTIVAFKTVGTCSWPVPTGVTTADVLVVGGGGGGGARSGGGGGAGKLVEATAYALTASPISVVVGAGGAGAAGGASTNTSQNGSNSSFSLTNGLTALGGGAGKYNISGASGGSGGGTLTVSPGSATSQNQFTLAGSALSGISWGNSGGTGASDNSTTSDFWAGGGGGGAGSAGGSPNQGGAGLTALTNASSAVGGPGGSGKEVTWISSSVATTLGVGQVSSSKTYFAGGGGGGMGADGLSGGAGGVGGGAAGTRTDSTPNSGTPNTGGGGGGSGYDDISSNGGTTGNAPAGSGGSGVVVVRYATPVPSTVQNFSAATRLVDADSATDSVTLSWDALTGQTPAVTSYEIEYSTASNYASSATQSVAVTNSAAATPSTATISGLTDGATYYFRIKARNTAGDSASYAQTTSVAVSNEDFALDTGGGYASAPATSVIPDGTSSDFSVEFWFRADTVTGDQVLISQGNSPKYVMKLANASLKVEYGSGEIDTGQDFVVGNWYHIAHTIDASDASTGSKVYVNGVLVKTSSGTRSLFSPVAGANGFHIGAYSPGPPGSTDGQIDQVKVWNDVRSQPEVVASMHAWGNPVSGDTSLISHYDFNDNTQTTVLRDQAGPNDLAYTSAAISDLKPLVAKDISTRSGYAVFKFERSYLTSSSGWTVPAGVSTGDYLLVGGGGAGGGGIGAGGGAGEFLERTDQSLSGTLGIVVGAGGLSRDNQASLSGQPSSLGSISVFGGGSGGSGFGLPTANYFAPSTGNIGSGGGGYFTTSGQSPSKDQSDGFSFAGGDGNNAGGAAATGGGGGGAGGPGLAGDSSNGGAGGIGKSSTILGTVLAGGGGGGVNGGFGAISSGSGGLGSAGGGNGGLKNQTAPLTNDGFSANPNSGSGGGGASNFNSASVNGLGGAGGSGVVVISYQLSPSAPTITSVSSITATTASVAFTAPASAPETVTKYQWSIDGTNWTDFSGTTSPQTVSGLTQNTAYSNFKIRAVSGSYVGVASDASPFTTSFVLVYEPLTGSAASALNGIATTGSQGLTGNWETVKAVKQGTSPARDAKDVNLADEPNFSFPANSAFTMPSSNTAAAVDAEYQLRYAARQLTTPISFDETGTYYMSFLTRSQGSSMVGLLDALPTSSTDNSDWALFSGLAWNGKSTIDFGNANEAVWVNKGPGESGTYSASSAAAPADIATTPHFFVVRFETVASGNDRVSLRSFRPSDALPTDPSGITWDVTYEKAIAGVANYLAIQLEYNSTVDEIRIGKAWDTVAATLAAYAVTFNANGATSGTVPSSQSKTHGVPLTLATNSGSLVRTGYTFAGWNTQADGLGTDYAAGSTYSVDAADELFAKWTANTYNLTFNSNGGSSVAATTFTIGGSVSQPTDPTRTGYTFAGWSASNGGTAVSWPYSPGVTTDVTLYAKWTTNSYTVTYNRGDFGAGSDVTSTKTAGTPLALPDSATANGYFTRAGYTITYWSTSSNGSTSDYALGANYTTEADEALYPVWTANTLNVTWNSNSGSVVTGSTVATNATLSAPTAPTRSGFNFAGWSATDGGAIVSFPFTHGKTADFTMYAVWERATYTVTFDYNYLGVADGTLTHNSGGTVTLPTPASRSGYDFMGWYTAASGGTKVGDAGATASTLSGTDLILRYELDDPISYGGTGTTVTDTASAISSVTGSVNGTAINGPTFSTQEGMYFNFDGANDYLRTGNLYDRMGAGNNQVSLFAWVYPTGNGVVVSEIGQTTINSSWHDSQIEVVGGKFKFRTWSPAAGSTPAVTSGSITLNQWYYVGLVYDGIKLTGYVNGVSVGSTANYTRSAPTTGLYYALAATDSTHLGDSSYGDFRLGSFHVYKSGISADTVLDNYQATCIRFDSGCTQQTLYGQWEAAGYVVTYAAGDNGTGTSQTASKVAGVALTLPDSATSNGYFTRTGYTVTSWSTNSDGSTSDYALEGNYSTDANETLYPVWTPDTYTITFNKGASGTGSDVTATKTHDVDFTIPNSATSNGYFTRTGYTVSSWSTSADGSTSDFAFGASYSTEAAGTLYPVWTPNTYTVTYNYNGATGGNGFATSSYTVGGIVISLPTPTKTGYTFAGWYSDSGLTTSIGVGGASYSPAATGNAYAKWSATTFTVIFDYNGADGSATVANSDYTTGGTVVTLPTPTKTGYTFAGWFSNQGLTTQVGTGDPATYAPTSNLTIYAKWTALIRSVTYHQSNTSAATTGTVPVDSSNYVYQQKVIIKSNAGNLSRTGYSFAGWVVNADGTGTAKNAGESITVGLANIDLYPSWSANTYTITYHRNGASGSLAKASDSYTTGLSNVTLPGAGTMTKIGYDFGGWSTTATGADVGATYGTTQDITLYAVWTLKSISYSYAKGVDGDGNSLSSFGFTAPFPTGTAANYGTAITLSSSVDSAIDAVGSDGIIDHQFFGWSDGNSVYDAGDTYILGESNPTFTAQWAKVYAVRYSAAGGTFSGTDAITDAECLGGDSTCTSGQQITLNSAPDRSGYTFLGWKDQSGADFTAGQTNVTLASSSYLFYAQWQAISYNMGFNSLGGSNAIANQTKTIGQLVTMPNPGTKTGYTFGGWSDGIGLYGVGTTFTVGSSSKSFSAQWTSNNYNLSYDWRGGVAAGSSVSSDVFTFSPTGLSLPTATGAGYTRDGYVFAGWSKSADASNADYAIGDNYSSAADDVLYAIWDDGNYTITYTPKGGGNVVPYVSVGRTLSITLATPTRTNFTFLGWYDSAADGNKLGDGGDSYTPTASTVLYARWIQDSLFGVDLATLETAATLTVDSSQGGGSITKAHSATGTSATVDVPSGVLPANTVVTARYFKDTDRQASLIASGNNYIFSLLVSWLSGSGDTATVEDLPSGSPIVVTLSSSAIKAGQMVYQVIGTEVTPLGRAEDDGSVVVRLTTDPEIVVAATKPDAPTAVTGSAGDTKATISWTAGSNGGAAVTSYTVTASPGGASCTSATTSCIISGLTNNTAYTFSVTATNSLGTSASSAPSSAVTPIGASYVVTFDSNGGSAVADGSFFSGGSFIAPSEPYKSGYRFVGWSTVLDDDTTEVTFPYSPGVTTPVTLFALWELAPVSPYSPVTNAPTTPASSSTEHKSWTKKTSSSSVKVYSKNVIGVGKVQFYLNGREIAWIRTEDEDDAKLRKANGFFYLVRTIALRSGKNVVEIYVDGIRTNRVAYTR